MHKNLQSKLLQRVITKPRKIGIKNLSILSFRVSLTVKVLRLITALTQGAKQRRWREQTKNGIYCYGN